jgi:hypothetical protein
MYRLSRAAARPMSAYDARHGFGTRKLVQGHDHLTVAELMGHRDGTMLAKVYGHLDRNVDHLKRALSDCPPDLPQAGPALLSPKTWGRCHEAGTTVRANVGGWAGNAPAGAASRRRVMSAIKGQSIRSG